jgi:hypothetical protein
MEEPAIGGKARRWRPSNSESSVTAWCCNQLSLADRPRPQELAVRRRGGRRHVGALSLTSERPLSALVAHSREWALLPTSPRAWGGSRLESRPMYSRDCPALSAAEASTLSTAMAMRTTAPAATLQAVVSSCLRVRSANRIRVSRINVRTSQLISAGVIDQLAGPRVARSTVG